MFRFILVVEVRILCRTWEFFNTTFTKPHLHAVYSVHSGTGMVEQVWASSKFIERGCCNDLRFKDILGLPNLWQEFGEEPHVGLMIKCSYTSHLVVVQAE